MNKGLFAGAAGIYFCALGVGAYTDVSSQLHGTAGGSAAATHESIDREDREIGDFNFPRLCQDGLTVAGNSVSPCLAAYAGARRHGESDHALKFAAIGCERDKDQLLCRKANMLAVRMTWGGPVTKADILAAATTGR